MLCRYAAQQRTTIVSYYEYCQVVAITGRVRLHVYRVTAKTV